MTEPIYDSAIAGGGLAGLSLAIQLADAGHSVVLFEKEKYPFHKVCGEYISMESYAFLQRLGLPLGSMDLPHINEVLISSPSGRSFTRPLGLGGLGIRRFTLDALLAGLARQKGVNLLEATKVDHIHWENESFSIAAHNQVFTARTAFGAFGKLSALEKTLRPSRQGNIAGNAPKYIGIKYHIKTDLPAHRIELHHFQNGYCGVSKVDAGQYCLCYLTDANNLKRHNNDISTMEEKVLLHNPLLRKYFKEATFINQRPLTISQITFHQKTAVENHVLLLGDAAGTIAPLCGNGMSMAMRAAMLAAQLTRQLLKGTLSRPAFEARYQQEWSALFAGRIRAGQVLQRLSGNRIVTDLTIRTLNQLPWLADRLIGLTHGQPF